MKLALAVLMSIIGTILVNYSGYMQKRELNYLPRIGAKNALKTAKAFFTCTPWLEAQALMFIGTFTHSIALAFAPLSIVLPIHTSGIVLLAVLAILKLGERASKLNWMGIGAIVLGLLFMGVSMAGGSGASSSYNPFFVWFLIVLLILTAGGCFVNAFIRKGERGPVFLAIGTGILLGLNDILEKLLWPDVGNRFWNSGLGSIPGSPYLWMIIFVALSTLFLGQMALQRGKAIVVIPVINGLANLIPILVGLLAFGERFPSSATFALMRLASIFFIIGGAILLSMKKELEGEGVNPRKTEGYEYRYVE
jgi:multidrug transporter EmrE-like cation transporter